MSARGSLLCAWLLMATGCADTPEVEAGGAAAPGTSGGESGWARQMPSVTPTTPAEAPAAPAAGVVETPADAAAPVIGPAPLVESERPPPPPPPEGTPSPWGAADAESGTPLPPRKAMNRKASKSFERGVEAAKRFDHDTAAAEFERALADGPRAYQAAYNLGVVSDRAGRVNVALKHYRTALELQPDYERAVEGIVRIHLRNHAASAAVAEAQPIAKRWERNLYLQAILAEALIAAGRVDEAERAARSALRRDERFVPAMVALARASLARGRQELAASILEQATAVDAANPEIHFLQGQAHQREGRLLDALNSYRRAVELRPEYAEARMALGVQYLAAGNYVAAREQLEVTVRLVPTQVAAHLNLGDAYRANKEWTKAKSAFDDALHMQDRLPEAHFNLGLMYMSAGGEFPQLDVLGALERAMLEFATYREQMASRLGRDDPSAGYIADLQRQIEREKKRIEREQRRQQQERERGARGTEGGT